MTDHWLDDPSPYLDRVATARRRRTPSPTHRGDVMSIEPTDEMIEAFESASGRSVGRDSLAGIAAVLEIVARNEARLLNALEAIESLTKDTDGGDIDGDADIPIGEIRRVIAEQRARPAEHAEPRTAAGHPTTPGDSQ